MPSPTTKREKTARAGAARGEERLDSIRQVVLDLVATHGVEGVTIDAIASAAKASKATMYRRWATKSELINDAIQMSFGGAEPGDPGDLGSLRQELFLILDSAADMLRENGRLIIALIDGAQRDPLVFSLMRQQTQENLRDAVQRPLLRAIARGELAPTANLNVVTDVALPLLLHRAIWHEPINDRAIESLLDDIILPLLHLAGAEG